MNAFGEIIKYESAFLVATKKRLQTLSQISDGNPSLEPIYAALLHAYQAACSSMEALEADVKRTQTEQIIPHEQENALPVLQRRAKLVRAVFSLGRCLRERPSDVFRSRVKDEWGAILDMFQRVLTHEEISDADAAQYIDDLTTMICEFEQPEAPEAKKEPLWFKAVKGISLISLGWFGNDVYRDQYGWFKKKPQEAEATAP